MANPKRNVIIIILILVPVIVGLAVLNYWIAQQLKGVEAVKPVTIDRPVESAPAQPKKVHPKGKVICKSHLEPNRLFVESRFYIDDEQVAFIRYQNDREVERGGEIPDGKVEFFNQWDGTYGEENYVRNKRHGRSIEYYTDGNIKKTAEYAFGSLLEVSKYYIDGTVSLEWDYRGAPDIPYREVGQGKTYYRDGTLQYEFRLVQGENIGYNKSYNKAGKLVSHKKLDKFGNVLKEDRY